MNKDIEKENIITKMGIRIKSKIRKNTRKASTSSERDYISNNYNDR